METNEKISCIPEIVLRNRDVEHIMNASSYYGCHGLGETNVKKCFSMLVTTDVHRCAKQMRSAVEYLNYYEALDCGVCLGDIMGADFAESDGKWYVNEVLKSEKPFYTVLGNHDFGNSERVAIAATTQMSFEKFIVPLKEKIGLETLDRPYYMVQNDQYKIVLLVLNSYDTPDDLDEDGNYKVHRGKEMILQAQTDWLIEALQSVPQGYHVLLALHTFCYSHIVIDGVWTQKGMSFNSRKDTYGQLPDIMNAWINGTKLQKSYAPTELEDVLPKQIIVNCDFTARGKGDFVGYFVGHTHHDIVARCEDYPDQKVVCFASTACDTWQNYDSDLPRAEGTKAEDLITVVSVDTKQRQIRLVRIGSNCTYDLEDRIKTVIPY